MRDAVIVSAVRTPIGDAYKGSLTGVSVHDLGKIVVAEALRRARLEATDVDDLVLGEVLQGGGDIDRFIAVDLALADDMPGAAVNRQCASGMTAVNTAAAGIRAGMDRVVVAGGVESMTRSPITYEKAATPFGVPQQFVSPSHPDGPEAPNMNMGITVGENTAEHAGVTRDQQDEWAFGSHRKAVEAIDAGRFVDEVVPVDVPQGRGESRRFDTDEHPRRDTSVST